MPSRNSILLFLAGLALCAAAMGGVYVRFKDERSRLLGELASLRNETEKADARAALTGDLFLDADSRGSSEENVNDVLAGYVAEKRDFILADLKLMKLALYEAGAPSSTFDILTKGREESSWETPTGNYAALSKEANHFSSIGKVWMPWSIQFYGNFFVHGWPYYEGGEPVPQSYSGGCVRLSTEDAKRIYDFAAKGMPILIVEDDAAEDRLTHLEANAEAAPLPMLTADAFIVVDISAGDVLSEKEGGKAVPVASITKLMTGVVTSELVYLDRWITITPGMLVAKIQSFPMAPGERYRAYDLLFPLLMRSSNGAASALAAFLGEKAFVSAMNEKAMALGMADTHFADTSGISDENTSTARDLVRLARYLLDKRRFLLTMTKGESRLTFESSPLAGIEDTNEFSSREDLIGMKNGETIAAKQTMLSLWNKRDASGRERVVAIVVLGADGRAKDTEALLHWAERSFNLK